MLMKSLRESQETQNANYGPLFRLYER
ncbi:hypothetical protein LQ247_18785 [Bacillus sp. BS3(2021)]|nr:hypothetical protein [Bacillus sp. BS3(2021)]MCJ8232052.1 hypothetical protein [Bacillus paralicheniformis]